MISINTYCLAKKDKKKIKKNKKKIRYVLKLIILYHSINEKNSFYYLI